MITALYVHLYQKLFFILVEFNETIGMNLEEVVDVHVYLLNVNHETNRKA